MTASSSAAVRGTRRFDPERRERIIDAAIDVARETGISNVTMRNVATQADVPLGSVSYHFADKDELIAAAIRKARTENAAFTRSAIEEGMRTGDLATALAGLIERLTADEHDRLVLDHDLYLAAMHHPKLQAESREWSNDLFRTMEDFTDPVSAQALTYIFDGVCLQSALFDLRFSAAEILPVIRSVIR